MRLRLGITRVGNVLSIHSPIALSTRDRVIESLRVLWREVLAPWKNFGRTNEHELAVLQHKSESDLQRVR